MERVVELGDGEGERETGTKGQTYRGASDEMRAVVAAQLRRRQLDAHGREGVAQRRQGRNRRVVRLELKGRVPSYQQASVEHL